MKLNKVLGILMSFSFLLVANQGHTWVDERSDEEKAYMSEGYAAQSAFIATTKKKPILTIEYYRHPQEQIVVTPDNVTNITKALQSGLPHFIVDKNDIDCVVAQLKEMSKVGLLRSFENGRTSQAMTIGVSKEARTSNGKGWFEIGPYNSGGAWRISVGSSSKGANCDIVSEADFRQEVRDYFEELQDSKKTASMMRLGGLSGKKPVIPKNADGLIDQQASNQINELISAIEGTLDFQSVDSEPKQVKETMTAGDTAVSRIAQIVAENEKLKKENATLKARLDKIEKLLGK